MTDLHFWRPTYFMLHRCHGCVLHWSFASWLDMVSRDNPQSECVLSCHRCYPHTPRLLIVTFTISDRGWPRSSSQQVSEGKITLSDTSHHRITWPDILWNHQITWPLLTRSEGGIRPKISLTIVWCISCFRFPVTHIFHPEHTCFAFLLIVRDVQHEGRPRLKKQRGYNLQW